MKSGKLGKVGNVDKVSKQESKEAEQEDPLGDVYRLTMKEAEERKLNPSQLFLLGSYCQMAANEMAMSLAMNSFGQAIQKHSELSRAEKDELKRQQQEAEGKVRVKPE